MAKTKRLTKAVGKRIEQLREERGYTRRGFARAAQIALTSMHLIEAGKRSAHLDTLERIARELEVPVRELFPEKPVASRPSAGTNVFQRVVADLRDRPEAELKAIEKLIKAFDDAVKAGR